MKQEDLEEEELGLQNKKGGNQMPDNIRMDKCQFCEEDSMCWHFLEDNGYTEGAACKDCLLKAVRKIDKQYLVEYRLLLKKGD